MGIGWGGESCVSFDEIELLFYEEIVLMPFYEGVKLEK